jgi:large subunit ribosomal protein L24
MHVKTGDTVVVTCGNEKGMRGKVLRVLRKENRVIVEGVNVRTQIVRKTPQNPQGGQVDVAMPIAISNVLLWSEKAGKGVRTKVVADKQHKVRVGIPCGTKFD